MKDKVQSPCINVCALDEWLVCRGCGRTIQEIADWEYLSEEYKQAVVEKAQKRKEQHE